jgi:DUF2934 family protein
MHTLESSKRVLRRGRVQDDRRDEAAEASSEIPMHLASAEERQQMIAVAAYFRAQGHNFEPGQEVEDWLAAEAEIDEKLSAEA